MASLERSGPPNKRLKLARRLKELTAAEEARIGALVKQAVS